MISLLLTLIIDARHNPDSRVIDIIEGHGMAET